MTRLMTRLSGLLGLPGVRALTSAVTFAVSLYTLVLPSNTGDQWAAPPDHSSALSLRIGTPLSSAETAEYDALVALFRNSTAFFGRDEDELVDLKARAPLNYGFRDALCVGTDFADKRVVDAEFGPWTAFLEREPEVKRQMWQAALEDRPEFENLDIIRIRRGRTFVRNRKERKRYWKNCRKNYGSVLEHLASLARAHGSTLPDIWLVMDCRDGNSRTDVHFPYLAASKLPGVKAILVPNFQYVQWLMRPAQAATQRATGTRTSWDSKIPKAVWRGTLGGYNLGVKEVLPLHHVRPSLLLHGRKHPDLVDAECTPRGRYFNYTFPEWDTEVQQRYCQWNHSLSWNDQIDRYKYMVSVDSFGAAFRVWRLLASGLTPMLPSDNTFLEHYYSLLEPWVHYVPSATWELDRGVRTLQNDDHLAKRIALNALRFARRNLSLRATFCYFHQVWTRMAELQEGVDWREMERWYGDYLARTNATPLVSGSDVRKKPFVSLRELSKLGIR